MDWQYPAKPYDSTVTATVLPNYDSDAEMAVVNVKWTIPLEIEAISRFNQGQHIFHLILIINCILQMITLLFCFLSSSRIDYR